MSKRRDLHLPLLALCFMSLFCLGLIDNSRAAIYPLLLSDLKVTNSSGALFFAVTSGFQLVCTFLARWWLPKWQPLGGLRRFLFLAMFASMLVGGATFLPETYRWPAVLFGAVILGLAFGGLAICQNALIAEAASPAYQRRAYGGLHMMYGLSSFAAPFFISQLLELGASWGQCFIAAAILPFGLAFRALALKEPPHRHVDPQPHDHRKPYEFRQWMIALVLGVYVIAEVAISSRLVLFGVRDLGLSQIEASRNLSLFFLGLLSGRMVLGLRTWSIPSARLLLISTILSLVSYVLGLTHWPVMLSLCGLMMSPFFPTAMAWMSENLSRRVQSTTSLIMLFQGVMLMGMHQTMGLLEQSYSVRAALWIGPIALILTLVGIHILRRTEKQVVEVNRKTANG